MSKLSGLEVFGGILRTKILILVRMLGSTYATELARLLELAQPSVAQAVRSLETQGLLAITTVGNQRMVSLNPRFFAASELNALLDKLAEADPSLLKAVAELRRRPRKTGKKLQLITQNSTLIDVAFAVCTGLDAAGITAVLTGGAATMLYAGEMLPSDDADFIIGFGADKETEAVMRALGFTRNGRIYANPNTRFTVEFPTGPLSIGAEIITEWEKRERGDECLYVLSAFDAVRDRLCWYFYHHDFSALAAAVAIARHHEVDIAAVQEWGGREFARDRSYDQVKKAQFFAKSLHRNRADPQP